MASHESVTSGQRTRGSDGNPLGRAFQAKRSLEHRGEGGLGLLEEWGWGSERLQLARRPQGVKWEKKKEHFIDPVAAVRRLAFTLGGISHCGVPKRTSDLLF